MRMHKKPFKLENTFTANNCDENKSLGRDFSYILVISWDSSHVSAMRR